MVIRSWSRPIINRLRRRSGRLQMPQQYRSGSLTCGESSATSAGSTIWAGLGCMISLARTVFSSSTAGRCVRTSSHVWSMNPLPYRNDGIAADDQESDQCRIDKGGEAQEPPWVRGHRSSLRVCLSLNMPVIIYGVIPAPIRKGNFAGEEHGADVSSDHQKPRLILNAFSLCLCNRN